MILSLGVILLIFGLFMCSQNTQTKIGPALAIIGATILLMFLISPAKSQHEHHSAAGRFYETWMMPDARQTSCCNKNDCYAVEARKVGGRWEAKRREDGKWLSVPDEKIERERDNPDGRNHLCAPPPEYGDKVYCFAIGGGT